MNKLVNETGQIIIAAGQDGSHIRNKEQYNKTLPQLIEKLHKNWAWGGLSRHTDNSELEDIMELNGVPKEKYSNLVRSAYYYFDKERGVL